MRVSLTVPEAALRHTVVSSAGGTWSRYRLLRRRTRMSTSH
jgi:hypothetical protein